MGRGLRGQGQLHRSAAQELTEEVEGGTPLLPAGPPHRHQHGLRPRTCPGPAATPDLAGAAGAGRGGRSHVFPLCELSSYYFRFMTWSVWMPVFIGERF